MSDSPFRPLLVPRADGRADRTLAVFDATDAHRFHEAVGPIARCVDATLGPAVLADRLCAGALSPHGHDWLLPWRPAMLRLRQRAAAYARQGRPLALRADVADCFGSIQPEVVVRALLRLGAHPSRIGPVLEVLEAVGEAGVRGLPVGPAGSTVLANAVLRAVDEALAGVPFLRWVDDFFVFVGDHDEARDCLERIRTALTDLGLDLAEDKTLIAPVSASIAGGASGVEVGSRTLQSLPT